MQSCSKQIKIDFRFFKVATLCLDDSFAHSWHSLTWNAFHMNKHAFSYTWFLTNPY